MSPSTGTIPFCVPFRGCSGGARQLALSVVFSLCAFVATFAAGCSSINPVPVRHSGTRQFLLVPVAVNGIPTTFLFDTGSTHTMVSKEFADRAGIRGVSPEHRVPAGISTTGATLEGHVANLKSFRVGSIRAKRKPGQVLIVDLPHLRRQFGEDVAGVLGNATWSSADYVLDAGRPSLGISRRLKLSKSPEALRLKVSGNRTYLPVEINGQPVDFLLDTGSSATRVTQALINEIKPFNSDYVELEIKTMGATENKRFPALHAELRMGHVHIPEFTFLIGNENVIGLNILRFGELSVSTREGMFIFRRRLVP